MREVSALVMCMLFSLAATAENTTLAPQIDQYNVAWTTPISRDS